MSTPKKIAIVNTADSGGGAERVAFTLAASLRKRGHKVSFLCGKAHHDSSIQLTGKVDWVLGRVLKRIGYADSISLASCRFLKMKEIQEADVIHFHNIHGFYFGVMTLPRIFANKPCIWTLHDLWGISGGCYGQLGCQKWLKGCKPCPGHGIFPMDGIFDTAAGMLKIKRNAIKSIIQSGGIITGVSEWITDRIKRVVLDIGSNDNNVHCINNYVDIMHIKSNHNQLLCNVPSDRPILLLVASNVNFETKGMFIALRALSKILSSNFTLITVGEPFPENILEQCCLQNRTVQLGKITDRSQLKTVYERATITIVPSLAESFCLVAAESIACGTPVIASNIMALPEIVREGETGLLAEVGNVQEFSKKILSMIELPQDKMNKMRQSTLKFAKNKFMTIDEWVKSYIRIYNNAIDNHRPTK